MSQVAARPANIPAEAAAVQARLPAQPVAKGRSDENADADFTKHIEDMATGGDAGTQAAHAGTDARHRPLARWHTRNERELLAHPMDDTGAADSEPVEMIRPAAEETPQDGAEALRDIVEAAIDGIEPPHGRSEAPANPAPEAGQLARDLAAAASSTHAAAPVDTTPLAGDSDVLWRTPTARSPVAAAPPTAPADSADVAADRAPDAPRTLRVTQHAVVAAREVHDVLVVGRETHLPPPPSMLRPESRPNADAPAQSEQASARVLAAAAATSGKNAATDLPGETDTAVQRDPDPAAVPGNDADRSAPVISRRASDVSRHTAESANSTPVPPGPVPPAGSHPRAQVTEAVARDGAQPLQAVRATPTDEQPTPQATVALPIQVADAVATAIDASPARDAGNVASITHPAVSHAAQPVKVVTIQLAPAELGTVTVRIALRNDAIELQVETSRRETARLVDADRETLSGLLRSAGYHVDALTVRAVEQPASGTAPGPSQGSPEGAPQSQSQSQGGSQADQRASGGRAHAGQDREGHGTRQDIRSDEGGTGPHAGRDLYV